MPYYKRLCELREDNDMSQDEVAKLLGMKQPQYSRYELGKRDIPTELLKKLCVIYNVSADYILELPKDLEWPR